MINLNQHEAPKPFKVFRLRSSYRGLPSDAPQKAWQFQDTVVAISARAAFEQVTTSEPGHYRVEAVQS